MTKYNTTAITGFYKLVDDNGETFSTSLTSLLNNLNGNYEVFKADPSTDLWNKII